jgi:hypothetical protein
MEGDEKKEKKYMKKAILLLFLIAGAVSVASVPAQALDYDGLLPYSNTTDGAVLTSTAVPFAVVAVSSTTPTRIDSAVNTALALALGNNYKRAEFQVRVVDGATVTCNYSSASVSTTTSAGFAFTTSINPVGFPLGKSIGIWCQGVSSTATFIVGGLGYK